MRRITTALAAFFFATTVLGAEGEGAAYAAKCKAAIDSANGETPSSTQALDIGFCLGLMDGVRGANFFLRKADSEMAFCEPAAFDNFDLAKTFIAGVASNENLQVLRGALAAQVVLAAAYPCEK